jgi:MFS family permease
MFWAILFQALFRDDPATHPWVSPAELAFIRKGRSPEEAAATAAKANSTWAEWFARFTPELLALAGSLSFWALCMQSIFRAFGHALFFTWFPEYLVASRGISLAEAGTLASFPLASVIAGSLVGGVVSDAILRKTGSLRASRSWLTVVVLLAAGVSFVLMDAVGGPAWIGVGIMTLGMFLFGMTGSTTWAATIDLGRERTPIVFAVMNMTGNFGAWACPVVVGLIFEGVKEGRFGWSMLAWVFLGNFILAAACWAFLDPNKPIRVASDPVHQ